MMKVRDIVCGPVLDASGVRGFFGEGYWYHKVFYPVGLTFSGSTFVSKTTTLIPNSGAMPLNPKTLKPREWFPSSVVVRYLPGVTLNAVLLSNPGIRTLLEDGRWQERTEPFFISLAAVHESDAIRREELRGIVHMIAAYRETFAAPFGVQLNVSCPNLEVYKSTGHRVEASLVFITDVMRKLDVIGELGVPVMVKLSVTLPPAAAYEIACHPACDAIAISNAIPWGALSGDIDWHGIFKTSTSPLNYLGGGALSGAPLLPLVVRWVQTARDKGITIPINAGGGIMRSHDVISLNKAGASSIALGTVAILRPWRVRNIIETAHALTWPNAM